MKKSIAVLFFAGLLVSPLAACGGNASLNEPEKAPLSEPAEESDDSLSDPQP